MPEMDGFEVAGEIQHSSSFAGTTVLMLTSDNRAGDIARARQLGLAAYMVKPIKRRDLQYALSSALHPQPPEHPAQQPEETETAPDRSLKILLVDDSEDNRLLVSSFLKKLPYQVDQAENGALALEKFQHNDYDLVLMDVQMPVMDGYTASREIRQWEQQQGRSATPIIALTAFAQQDDAQKSLAAGCDAHLTKPIKKTVLLEAIDRFDRKPWEKSADN
jgi:CheY-like chemotaxis protein